MNTKPLTIAAFGAIAAVVFLVIHAFMLPSASAEPAAKASGETTAPASGEGNETSELRPSSSRHDGAIGLSDAVSITDNSHPAVVNLDPALLEAVREAAADARTEQGLETVVSGGWRSPAYQLYLLNDAVATYGSAEEATRWVATPETSSHVFGEAVDLGPTDVMYWMQQYGYRYGLCQTYANEVWHYELRPEARTEGCPVPYTDPTEDPRLQG